MNRKLFLKKQINKFLKHGSSILVFGGGQMEKEIFNNNEYNITF